MTDTKRERRRSAYGARALRVGFDGDIHPMGDGCSIPWPSPSKATTATHIAVGDGSAEKQPARPTTPQRLMPSRARF